MPINFTEFFGGRRWERSRSWMREWGGLKSYSENRSGGNFVPITACECPQGSKQTNLCVPCRRRKEIQDLEKKNIVWKQLVLIFTRVFFKCYPTGVDSSFFSISLCSACRLTETCAADRTNKVQTCSVLNHHHPSIHPFSTNFDMEPIPETSGEWTSRQLIGAVAGLTCRGKQPSTLWDQLSFCMFLDCGTKPEDLERTHAEPNPDFDNALNNLRVYSQR